MFGNKAQMQNMLKKARKMQEDLQKKQEELKKQNQEEREETKDRVTLSTMHSAKGLEYPVVFGKTRSVKLSGEALFDVAPDRKHPFIVQTFASDIRVLGTKFNVLADAERGEFTTTLIEGQVQVTNRANSNERITMYPHDVVDRKSVV